MLERLLRPYKNADVDFKFLPARTYSVRDLNCLKIAMGWKRDPILSDKHLYAYESVTDLNERRLRDGEVLGAACCNGEWKNLVEIGTCGGHSTAVMARNAPQAMIHTLNIPPEEISEGGTLVTTAPSREQIGAYYRECGLSNIRQIFANSAHWEPDIEVVDVAFIDGCHDTEFVINDTKKILARCKKGSLILWHDFNPELAVVHDWIRAVCEGVDKLYQMKILKGNIFHVRDSWIGLYEVPE